MSRRRARRTRAAPPGAPLSRRVLPPVAAGSRDRARTLAPRSREAGAAHAGFTLIELLVVVAIIGIVSAILVVAVQTAVDRARQRGTMADMRSLGMALETYNLDTSRYPVDGSSMTELTSALIPYQTSVVRALDHWQHEYHYASDGIYNYSVESYGKDGQDSPQISFATRFEFERDLVLSNGFFVASPDS